jgi:hypothetical protein
MVLRDERNHTFLDKIVSVALLDGVTMSNAAQLWLSRGLPFYNIH